MPTPIEKFQELLKNLFEFDCADLDFGIYRIMNHKRQVIERFIGKDLPKAVGTELSQGELAAQSQAAKELAEARRRVLDALGEEALDADGRLDEKYRGTKAGKEYLAAQENAKSAKGQEALEAAVYNHLYAFFSRYWQDGDFISKRRYSKKERYAVPYNGEEVMLYWANHDQYYIKTGEYFTDYSWKAPNGATAYFKLKGADVEQNNVKGEKRFFLPLANEIEWNADVRSLTVPFEFRPLTRQEAISYGQKNQQEAIIAKALETIPKRLSQKKETDALAALTAEKRRTDAGEIVTHLEHHLRQYTRRNTSDFFIHKDLKSFLARELDFYLKNEVLNLDELEAAGQGPAEGWFQLMRLIKKVGGRIIEFLAQIEDFQKMLWEKRKFVTEIFYVVTVGNVPKEFIAEIAACDAQWEEWKKLGMMNGESGKVKKTDRSAFLIKHPSLPLDTRHFAADFTDRLIAAFDDLDGMTDGLLVRSENWQALNLLAEKYRKGVKCVYIDPPYNTGGDGFAYKDSYQHASWLTMISERLSALYPLFTDKGVFFSSIDAIERNRLEYILNEIFQPSNRVEEIIWVQNTTKNQSPTYSTNHEYVEVFAKNIAAVKSDFAMFRESKPGYTEIMELIERLNPDCPPVSAVEDALRKLYLNHKAEIKKEGRESLDAWKGIYNYNCAEYRDSNGKYVEENEAKALRAKIWVWREVDTSMPQVKEDSQKPEFRDPAHPTFRFYKPLHPKTGKPCPAPKRGWSWPFKPHGNQKYCFSELAADHRIAWGEDENKIPQRKSFLHEVETNVAKSVLNDYTDGEKELTNLFGQARSFGGPKPTTLITRFCQQASVNNEFVMDCFAGSGTTGHAVINLNREDGRQRKLILVEMGNHFDTVLLPRIKKVTFSPGWKDGAAKRPATKEEAERGPRIVKVIRLESYEDSLNNLSFGDPSQAAIQFDDYLLRYMLLWETRKSETLLNVDKLSKPFSYKLQIHRNGETDVQAVDLAETFNYLIGLNVQTRRVIPSPQPSPRRGEGAGQYLVYRGVTREGRKTVVIWRETEDWKEKDYVRDRDFVAAHKLSEGADDVYVNGDSLIPGCRALEQVFKTKMFGTMEG